MTSKYAKVTVLTCAILTSASASAQPITAEEAAQLRARLNQLEAEVSSLRARLESTTATQVAAPGQVVAQPAAPAKAAAAAAQPDIKWRGAPEFEGEGGWTFKPRGRLLFDVGNVSAPNSIVDNRLGFSNELRRARLGVQGTVPGGFGYRFEAEVASGSVELIDAFFDFKYKGLTVTLGQHNNFQSLEELSNSNDSSFIERAAFTDAFGFERRLGLSAAYKSGAVLAQAGVFTDNVDDLTDSSNNAVGLDGRLIFAPKLGNTQLHLGGSIHWRDTGDLLTSTRYRQRPLVRTTDIRFIDTNTISGVSSETGYGLEAAAISGRFHAAGEAYWQHVNRNFAPDPTFFGGAIEAGFFLTDDSRSYWDGTFRAIKVKNPLSKGGSGAIQVNLRYDYLDLVDAGIVGGVQNGYIASLIWTPEDYLRFMLNYGRLEYDDAANIVPGAPAAYSVDVVGARAQISF